MILANSDLLERNRNIVSVSAASEPIKVLHLVYSLGIGGMENGVANLINGSSKSLFRHEICCISGSGSIAERLPREVRLYEINKREGENWRVIHRLASLIREIRPDFVHTRNWGTIDGVLAAAFAGVPFIVHGEHGWSTDDPEGKNKLRRLFRRLVAPCIDRFVTVSEDIRQWLTNTVGVPSSKVEKIINGVDVKRFYPCNDSSLRSALGLDESTVIGTVCRLDPIKQLDGLFKAFTGLASQNPHLKLVIVGTGPQMSELENLRVSLPCGDKIILTGAQRNVERFYRLFDVFVCNSRNEGTSNTILEAMATALPVVATAVGGNLELIKNDVNGLLVPSGNSELLAETLGIYVRSPLLRKRHGLLGRTIAEREFALEAMVRAYEKLYLDIQKPPRKRPLAN